VDYTFPTAADSEVVIAIFGLDPTLEGEEGDTPASPTGGDRTAIELPGSQLEFLTELRKHSKKLVLVLTGGSAIAIPEAHDLCDAVVQVWYSGCEGGRALADVLFGEVSPSGKLPISVPRHTSDLPPFEDYAMRGRTYRFVQKEPLYPFGFGLGYARLSYAEISLTTPTLQEFGAATVGITLANGSALMAHESVQCYIVPPPDWPDAPNASLVDFQKVSVPPDGETRVEFTLPADVFRQFDATGHRVWVPGRYKIVVGSASPGERALALGAPGPGIVDITLS
jgi:beta-glucosidase